jgi:hypothetical protein
MNLIQITEQLKNPAVSVQQLMQYANNSNPEVPSYVALAEMQRRQSMQAPPQAPQQTVKDQLGSQLMGLPSVAPGASPGAAPQQPSQPTPQPPTQQASQPAPPPEQVPMPEPKQALPNPPGMAGGGLTSIPLNMHHDFASGGIIAFADGGYPSEYEMPEERPRSALRQERETDEASYGISKDPYADIKRRYADIEEKQKRTEEEGNSRRLMSGLAAYAAAGPKSFAEAAGGAAKSMQDMRQRQEALSEQAALKMAELQTAFAEKEDARRRGDLAADRAAEEKIQARKKEILGLRHQYTQSKASETSAEASKASAAASTKNAQTQASKEEFDQKNYPQEFALKQQEVRARIANALQKPAEIQVLDRMYAEARALDPAATYADTFEKYKMAGAGVSKEGRLTYKDALKQASEDPRLRGDALVEEALRLMSRQPGAGGGLPAAGAAGKPNPNAGKSNAQILQELGIK